MSRLGKLGPHQAQLVVGCAGWDPGQLAAEVQAGCWFVLAASDEVLRTCVFGKPTVKLHVVRLLEVSALHCCNLLTVSCSLLLCPLPVWLRAYS